MQFMHILASAQLICLSPCPNFNRDLVCNIKNKVLAHRLATLPFLWLSCERDCISFKVPQIPGPSMDLFCSSQLWSSRGDAAQTLSQLWPLQRLGRGKREEMHFASSSANKGWKREQVLDAICQFKIYNKWMRWITKNVVTWRRLNSDHVR